LDYAADGSALISGCRTCGLVFIDPLPSAEEIASWYGPGGTWDRKLADRKERQTEKYLVEKSEVATKQGWLRNEPRALYRSGARTVLDYGCGHGKLLDKLQAKGWTTYGVDPNTRVLERHHLLTETPAAPQFDLVILKHVIEHLANPLKVMHELRRALIDDGHLLIACPTLDRLAEHRKIRYCVNKQHITAYTARSLQHLLAVSGFRLVRQLPTQSHRMAFLYRAAKPSRGLIWPLRDAELEILRMRWRDRGWRGLLPVRAPP
jgi:2-polyprenyl-3-methyl-5-hydroxy-6-metoxy-1,4-benzoquinol methylase